MSQPVAPVGATEQDKSPLNNENTDYKYIQSIQNLLHIKYVLYN